MTRLIIFALAASLAGCTSDQTMRRDGVTPGAGNAIAANTAMQMVDPWMPGVQNTNLRVPSSSGAQTAAAPAAPSASSQAAATTSTN